MKIPSDKGTPTVRSVRKAEGLEVETARLPTKAFKGKQRMTCGTPTCRKEAD